MTSLWDQPAAQPARGSPSTTTRKLGEKEDIASLRAGQLANKTMNASRASAPFDTPPRNQPGIPPFATLHAYIVEGNSLSGFQSPYTPPTAVQRAPPAPIFTTPQREQATATSQPKTSTPSTNDTTARTPETPKVGGKWTHPALHGIDREARKFVFGEED